MPNTSAASNKKRPQRRPRAPWWGAPGRAVFFALLFFGGLAFLAAVIAWYVIPDFRANNSFAKTQATVVNKRLEPRGPSDQQLVRPDVKIAYQVHDRAYEIWTYDIAGLHNMPAAYSSDREAQQAKLDRFVVGKTYDCWYDPLDPKTAVLVRGYDWLAWVMLLLPVGMIAAGGSGLGIVWFNWGTSTERRAVLAQKAANLEIFETGRASDESYPTVPRDADLTNSAGVRLRYRLPIEQSQTWLIFATGAVAVVVNGLVAVFATMAARSHLAGKPDWFMTLFVVPWVLVGVATIVYFLRQVLIATGVGQTVIEVSEHPLVPGRACQAYVAQTGRLSINRFELQLVCEEWATYRQGTNTRTTTKPVRQMCLLASENFEIRRGKPYEEQMELIVPVDVMHSFASGHNAVRWKFVVLGDVKGWPNYRREYPVIVLPAPAVKESAVKEPA